MNDISMITNVKVGEERTTKGYEIFTPDKKTFINGQEIPDKGAAVIPPKTQYTVETGGTVTALEKAVLPFKTVCVIQDGSLRDAVNMAKAYFMKPLNKRESVLSAFGNLICTLACELCEGYDYSPVVALVKKDIENNISNVGYALDAYLKKLPLNYDYVRKLFKKQTGTTPHEYLTAKRMELAQKLLSSGISNSYSNYSVGQISEICGFSEPLYFSRVFKNYFGVSPSDYIKGLKT